MSQEKLKYKGEYSKNDGGKIKIIGLSLIQYDTIMALIRSWRTTENVTEIPKEKPVFYEYDE